MSKSPLSGAFSGSSEPAKKKSKKNGAILLIAGVALASSIGGVFAAGAITINGTDEIEFGQGVAEVIACDSAATVSMNQTFDTDDEVFYVTTVDVEFTGTAGACDGLSATVGLILDDGTTTTFEDITETVADDAVQADFTGLDHLAADVVDVSVTTAD
jgi:hypothetical protein